MVSPDVVRKFYRVSLRLVKDIQRSASQSVGSHHRNTAALVLHALNKHNAQGSSVEDVHSLVRASYRKVSGNASTQKTVEQAVQGIRDLEELLLVIKSEETKKLGSTISPDKLDDSWTSSMIAQVEWLPSLIQQGKQASDADKSGLYLSELETDTDVVELPMVPLTQPFFAPNEPFHLFTRFAPWEFPMPGDVIQLYVRESRYIEIYNETFSPFKQRLEAYQRRNNDNHVHVSASAAIHANASTYNRHFVVPFAHPHQPATFAQHGWLFRVDDWTSMRGPAGLVYCSEHTVVAPVKIERVLNPEAFSVQDTCLRAHVRVLDDDNVDALPVSEPEALFQELHEAVEGSFAAQCQRELQQGGVFSFLEAWNAFLKQSIQQLELHLGHRVLQEVRRIRETTTSTNTAPLKPETLAAIAHNVHKPFRYRLLKLKLSLAMSIPRLLQSKTAEERRDALMDLIKALY